MTASTCTPYAARDRQLQPSPGRLQTTENIAQSDSHGYLLIGNNQVDVHDEETARYWPKENVEIATGQGQALGPGGRKLNVVGGRHRSSNTVHRTFHSLILSSSNQTHRHKWK